MVELGFLVVRLGFPDTRDMIELAGQCLCQCRATRPVCEQSSSSELHQDVLSVALPALEIGPQWE